MELLRGQPFAAFRTPGVDHGAAVFGRHAGTKAVSAFAV